MNKINLILIGMILVILSTPLILSAPPFQSSGILNDWEVRTAVPSSIKFNTTFDFHIHVFNTSTGTPIIGAGQDGVSCILHLYNSTGYHLFEGLDTTVSHNFDYGWEIDAGNITFLGELVYVAQCNDTVRGGFVASSTEITPTGELLTDAQGISFFGILMAMMSLAFFFVYLSLKFIDNDNTYPAGLFFLLIGILVSMQSLYMGVVYSRDYLSTAISSPQMTLFLALIYSLVGITFISLVFFTIKVIKELRERKSLVDYGENYNPKTKQYN